MNPGTKPETPEIHRGKRCGICAWALYDGAWCQNPNCIHVGKEPPSTIRLSNAEFYPWVSKRCMDAIAAEAEADRLRAALEDVLKSAIPNERDHPRMHAAWMIAREALAKQEGGEA